MSTDTIHDILDREHEAVRGILEEEAVEIGKRDLAAKTEEAQEKTGRSA